MLTQHLGKGMNLQVNEATGNLLLNYPVDNLKAPLGPLDVALTYNSQLASDQGLGAGGTSRPVRCPTP